MNETRWLIGTQIVTTLAVVIGLALVIWELRQAKEIANVQLEEMRVNAAVQHEAQIGGEGLAEAFVRIRRDSADITDADLVRYDAWVFGIIRDAQRAYELEQSGFSDRPWTEEVSPNAVCHYFGHSVGRAYLHSTAWSADDPVLVHLRESVARCGEGSSYLAEMRAAVSGSAEEAP